MADQQHKTVAGLSDENQLRAWSARRCRLPATEDQFVASEAAWQRWAAGGSRTITRAPSRDDHLRRGFDPEASSLWRFKMLDEAGVKIRLHSTFVDAVRP